MDDSRNSGRNSLTEMEGAECALKDGVIDESFAVVAKFYTKRKVNLEAVARTFQSAWKADGDFEFRDLGNNRALIVFSDEVDMNRVLIQSLWSFDKYLMAPHRLGDNECLSSVRCDTSTFWIQISNLPSRHMTKENGILIGNTLGEVITIDVPECGRVWSTCLRVRVKIDVTQPLCRGKMVRLGDSDRRWVSFRYERLPIYCYWCGKLTHDEKDCRLWIQSNGSLSQDSQQYGPWLRASLDRLQKPQVVKVGNHGPQQSLYGATYTAVTQSMVVQPVSIAVSSLQSKSLNSANPGITTPSDLNIPQNTELPSIQNNSNVSTDFEAQLREIDKAIEGTDFDRTALVQGKPDILPHVTPNGEKEDSNGSDKLPHVTPSGEKEDANKSM